MSVSRCVVVWERKAERFTDNGYSRRHRWQFDGGFVVPASSSPDVVPPPMSDEHCVDPEEAFVAALSSCHMLWFLSLAARRGWVVDEYRDEAMGTLERDANGKLAMTRVVLRPHVRFGGAKSPEGDDVDAIHELAHEECFLASSVKTSIVVEASWVFDGQRVD